MGTPAEYHRVIVMCNEPERARELSPQLWANELRAGGDGPASAQGGHHRGETTAAVRVPVLPGLEEVDG